MTIWTDQAIIDELGKMYSHRGDGFPTQPVYDFGDAAIALIERLRAERDSFAENAKVSEAAAIEWAAGVAEADTCDCAALDERDCSCGPPGRRIAAAIRKGRV